MKFVCVAYQTLKKDLGVLVFCDLQILKIADQPIDIVEIEGQHVIPTFDVRGGLRLAARRPLDEGVRPWAIERS